MNRITTTVALAMAALACSTAPAFADSEFSTDDVAPSWTAASAERCADPDVAPLLASFDDDDFYAPAPGGAQTSQEEDSDVRVEVIYPGLEEKNVRKAKDLKAKHGRGWELSDKIKLNPSHGLKHGGWRLVAIRIGVRDGKPNTLVRVDDEQVPGVGADVEDAEAHGANLPAASAVGRGVRPLRGTI